MAQARPGIDLTEDTSPSIISSVIVCMVISGLSVVARFASRFLKKTSITLSDWMILVGLAGAWAFALIIIEAAKRGLGKHVEVVGLDGVQQLLLFSFCGQIVYSLTFPVIKISILLFYRELFSSRFIKLSTLLISIFVVMWGIALLLVTIFSCNPIEGAWNIMLGAKCVDSEKFFWGNSIPNILADILILCLPIREVWNLQVSRATKAVVCGLFLLGAFVIVASGLRIHFLLGMDIMDMSWTQQGVGLWSAVEINVAVISACLPLIRPAIQILVPASVVSYMSKSRSTQATDDKSLDPSKAASSRKTTSTFGHDDHYEQLVEYPMQSMKSESSLH